MNEFVYLLWANDRGKWWKPDGRGYTPDIREAGRFAKKDAVRHVVASAQAGDVDQATVMVVAPETWPLQTPEPDVAAWVDPLVEYARQARDLPPAPSIAAYPGLAGGPVPPGGRGPKAITAIHGWNQITDPEAVGERGECA